MDGVDQLWDVVGEEISSGTDVMSPTVDTLSKQMRQHLENKLKGKSTQHSHGKDNAPILKEEVTLFGIEWLLMHFTEIICNQVVKMVV